MKNNKTFPAFCLIVIFSFVSTSYSRDAMGVKAAKEAVNGLSKIVGEVRCFLSEILEKNTDKANATLESLNEHVDQAEEVIQKASENFGLEAATKIAEASEKLIPIGWLVAGGYTGYKVFRVMSEIKQGKI